jgi:hypothetical protein
MPPNLGLHLWRDGGMEADWWTARAGVQLSQIPNGEVINGDLWGWGKDQIGIGGVLYGSGRIAM